MKKLIFLLVAVALVSFANAQEIPEKNVPIAVKSSLKKHFTNAKDVKWEKEKGNYEAGFDVATVNGKDLIFDHSGKFLKMMKD